jgi:hypothetical protein
MSGANAIGITNGILRRYRRPVLAVMVADPTEVGGLFAGNRAGWREPTLPHAVTARRLDCSVKSSNSEPLVNEVHSL